MIRSVRNAQRYGSIACSYGCCGGRHDHALKAAQRRTIRRAEKMAWKAEAEEAAA